jgi:hypothetical protein
MELRRSMTAVALALIAVPVLIAVLPSPAGATKRCPPVVVEDNIVLCSATNHGTSADTDVVILLRNNTGAPVASCPSGAIAPKASISCLYSATGTHIVSCEVTGEGSLTRVSFGTAVSTTNLTLAAAVECR